MSSFVLMGATLQDMLKNKAQAALREAATCLDRLVTNQTALDSIVAAGELLARAFQAGGKAYSCGNGGSMCDAMHFAEELSGKFRNERPPLAAMAISDPGYLSCTANDYGYDEVFARFVTAHGRKGDVLLAISTSGRSANVLKAAKQAKSLGMKVIALTGKPGSDLAKVCDIEIAATGGDYADRVQELHIKIIHILIELVEAQLFAGK